jgi:hypothetical protein
VKATQRAITAARQAAAGLLAVGELCSELARADMHHAPYRRCHQAVTLPTARPPASGGASLSRQ